MYLILVIAAAASLLAAVYIPIVAMSHGFSLGIGALAVGLLAVVNGTGRSMAGRLSDRFGRRQTLSAALLIEGCAQLGLVYSASIGQPAAFVVFAALSGLAGGAFYPLVASLVADYFGEPSAVRNFGMVYSAKLFGGLIGIGLPALLVASHSLMMPFLVAGLLSLCAAVDDADAAPPRPPDRRACRDDAGRALQPSAQTPEGVPMPTKAAVDKLHHLLADLQHCVASLESTYGDTPAMRRIVNDAHMIRNGIHRLEIDARGAGADPCARPLHRVGGDDPDIRHRLRRQFLAGRRPRRGWRTEPGRRTRHAQARMIVGPVTDHRR